MLLLLAMFFFMGRKYGFSFKDVKILIMLSFLISVCHDEELSKNSLNNGESVCVCVISSNTNPFYIF